MSQRRRGQLVSRRRQRPAPAGPPLDVARPNGALGVDRVSPTFVLFVGLLICAVAVPFAFLLSSNDVFELTKQVALRAITGAALVAAAAVWLCRDADDLWLRRLAELG